MAETESRSTLPYLATGKGSTTIKYLTSMLEFVTGCPLKPALVWHVGRCLPSECPGAIADADTKREKYAALI